MVLKMSPVSYEVVSPASYHVTQPHSTTETHLTQS